VIKSDLCQIHIDLSSFSELFKFLHDQFLWLNVQCLTVPQVPLLEIPVLICDSLIDGLAYLVSLWTEGIDI
jgi:hypothetical protein